MIQHVWRGLAHLLLIAPLTFVAGCPSPCAPGYVQRDGVCVDPNADAGPPCTAAPAGRYEGLTDQGLPVSFELSADRTQALNFAIDVSLVGPGTERPNQSVRLDGGFTLNGCAFAGLTTSGEYSGSFVPPNLFAGAWYTVFTNTTGNTFSNSGAWTATYASDGGVVDGGASDGGIDGGTPTDGGAADGGAADGGVADGGVADGGAADGGAADGGAADGGVDLGISVPAGFTVELAAQNLLGPIALAVDPATGDVYVAEYFAGRVRVLPLGASTLQIVAPNVVRPAGLALSGSGAAARLVIASEQGLSTQSLAGGSPLAFGPPLPVPAGPVACASADTCYVAEFSFGARGRSVWKVTASSAESLAGADGGIDQPFGLAPFDGGLLVAEANLGFSSADGVFFHEVAQPGGAVTGFAPTPLLPQPGALAPLRENQYFVSEVVFGGSASRRVFLLDRPSRTTRELAFGFALPAALAYDAARRVLFVADLSRGALYRLRGPFDALTF